MKGLRVSSIDFRQFQRKCFLSELSLVSCYCNIHFFYYSEMSYYSEVFYTVLKLLGILHGGWHLKGPSVSGWPISLIHAF